MRRLPLPSIELGATASTALRHSLPFLLLFRRHRLVRNSHTRLDPDRLPLQDLERPHGLRGTQVECKLPESVVRYERVGDRSSCSDSDGERWKGKREVK